MAVLAAVVLHGAVLALILLLPPRHLPEPEPREGAVLIWAEPDPSVGAPGAPSTVDGPPLPEPGEPAPTPPEPVAPVPRPPEAMIPREQAPPPPLIAVPLPGRPAPLQVPASEPPPLPPRLEPPRTSPRRAGPAAQAPSPPSPGTNSTADAGPAPWAAEGATTPPGPLDGQRNAQPIYPPTAQALGQQGTVRLRLRVDLDGSVAMVTLERGSGVASLDAAAIEAARRWRFRPATRNGQPVSAEALTSVTFRIPGGQPRF